MQRVMLNQSSVPMSPKRKRLSVGFGVNASVQIHKTATPPQQRSVSTHNDGNVVAPPDDATPGRRKNLHETLLMRLLSTPSDEPLFRQNSTDAPESQRTADDSFDSCLSGRSTPTEFDLLHQTPDAMRCNTPPMVAAAESAAAPPNRRMQLLMRDFNSPSATARLRAVRALNSVSKRNAYGNFDVSYAEQDIITAEERLAQEQRTIQDVMKEVCVYVEVRSGTDNRSEGIKEHIASLGAKVKERLLRDTTHVIFKDGLLSTYQKAKKMDIPIVSILWIEACKRHTCLMNPNDFKISNLERYENPDLFKRIRRQKSMQPGAEEAVGAKKRPNVTAKAKATTAAAVISPPSKLPVLHRIRKDDRLERILSDFEAENQINSPTAGPIDEYDELLQAAPMRMLERFRSTPTPMDREEENPTDSTTPTTTVTETSQSNEVSTRRELFTGSKSTVTPRNRRKTIMFTPQMVNVQEEDETLKQTAAVPRKSLHSSRRKTIVHVEEESVPTARRTGRTRRSTMIPDAVVPAENQSSLCEKNDLKQVEDTSQIIDRETIIADKDPAHTSVAIRAVNKRSRRKTIAFGNEENTPPLPAISMDITKTFSKTPNVPARGTICSPKDMDLSSVPSKNQANTRDATDLTKQNSNGTVISISSEEGNRPRVPNRRRTLFIPSVEGALDGLDRAPNETVRSSVGSSVTNRRKTILFTTPGHSTPMEPLEVTETPPPGSSQSHVTHADGSSIVNRPNPTSSSTPITTTPAPTTNGRKTLLEQYQDSLLFSSTRAPERRRRTVFDITMDIMDHRLSEINRQAEAAVASSATPKPVDKPAVVASAEAALKSPPSQTHQASLDAYYRKAAKSCEKAAQSVPKPTEEAVPRKRKLFNVQTSEEDVPAVIAKTTPKRRSLAPSSAAARATTVASNKQRRRSTAQFTSPIEPPAASQRQEREEQRKKLFPIGRGLPTMASQYAAAGTGTGSSSQQVGPKQYLATTNLHTEQSTFVKEAIARLDGFIVEATVTDNTTHLVTLESRRTINLLRALIRGLWIVRYEWIVESYQAGRWLPEERYELSDFSRAVQLNRSERQAFGSQYRNELYTDYAPFWLSSRCPIPVQQLRELILLCRGKVTGNAARAKFLVVDPNDNDAAPLEGQIVVAPVWILDSITVNKVKKLSKKYRVE